MYVRLRTHVIFSEFLTMTYAGEESFDISVEKELWLMVSVRDRALVGKHDTVGRAYLCLDTRRFGDFLAHELWMNLEPHGRMLIRVSMEGEKDDIRFFFGRAFRSLKRAEGDMLRIFIDKVFFLSTNCDDVASYSHGHMRCRHLSDSACPVLL